MYRGSITEIRNRKTTDFIHKVAITNQSLSTTKFIMHKVVAIVVFIRQILVTKFIVHKVVAIVVFIRQMLVTKFIMHKVVAIVVFIRQMLVTIGTSAYSA